MSLDLIHIKESYDFFFVCFTKLQLTKNGILCAGEIVVPLGYRSHSMEFHNVFIWGMQSKTKSLKVTYS